MKDTGRIKETLKKELQSIIYGKISDESIDSELKYVVKIDKAHILMLYQQKIINSEQAKKILNQIELLENDNFSALRGKDTPRGIYFLYEDYLRRTIGDKNGGMLQFGRSRNDLKATVLKIRLREHLLLFINNMFNTIELLLEKSKIYSDIIMPIYTHYQPAVPTTYGHYLAAIAEELLNILEDVLSNEEINKSPLGCGSVGGTTVPIDTKYTAKLLGFTKTVNNSIVGVSSRKIILDFLNILVEVESLISRCCEDYLLWTSSDFNFIFLPDNLVGGSSMMPNKRNAFLFENIRGKCSKALGAYVSSVTAMKGEPFTNSIAVGTEAVSYIWDTIKNMNEIFYIFNEIVKNAIPNEKTMLNRCKTGNTLATEYANYLTLNFNNDFRNAHKIVGELVRESINTDKNLEDLLNKWVDTNCKKDNINIKLDISSIVAATNYGWGAGKKSCKEIKTMNYNKLQKLANSKDILIKNWEDADVFLLHEIKKIEGE